MPLLRYEEMKDKMLKLIKHLRSTNDNQTPSNYYQDEITNLYYDFLCATDIDKANAFMYSNIDQKSMKIKAVEIAFQKEEYEYIINLSLKEIQNDSRNTQWYDYIVKAYQAKNQLEQAIPFMKTLILLGNLAYYEAYKAFYRNDKWQEEVDLLIEELSVNRFDFRTLEYIMVEEKRFDVLVEYIKQHKYKVFFFYELLNEHYFDETKLIMEQEIYHQIQTGSSKKHYNYRIRYLDIYLKAYGNNETKELVDSLKYAFKNRKALNEVLDAYLVNLT